MWKGVSVLTTDSMFLLRLRVKAYFSSAYSFCCLIAICPENASWLYWTFETVPRFQMSTQIHLRYKRRMFCLDQSIKINQFPGEEQAAARPFLHWFHVCLWLGPRSAYKLGMKCIGGLGVSYYGLLHTRHIHLDHHLKQPQKGARWPIRTSSVDHRFHRFVTVNFQFVLAALQENMMEKMITQLRGRDNMQSPR